MPDIRIVFLDRETLPDAVRFGRFRVPVELVTYPHTATEEVRDRIRDAEIVITNKAAIGRRDIEDAQRLRMIAVAATGTNMLDFDAIRERGIVVSNVRGYSKHSVPEHTFALMLALKRSLIPYRASVANGRWQQARQFCYFDFPITDLGGSTLGIFGGGTLGSAVARIGEAFGMTVLKAGRKGDPHPRPGRTPFDEVLERSDVLTLHLPLLPETRKLIAADEFGRMGRSPILINTARGGLVDEGDLHVALTSGQISGAAFDVAASEPPASDSMLMTLLSLPNFILTPHVAWASQGAIQALADQLTENIEFFIAGTPRNVVT